MVTIQIRELIDKALKASGGLRFSEEDSRYAVSNLALALQMLVNTLDIEIGDHK